MVFIFCFQELGIKHPLHRKKLVLAVKAINAKQEEKSALLDHIWVTRKDKCIFIKNVSGHSEGQKNFPLNICPKDGSIFMKDGWIRNALG